MTRFYFDLHECGHGALIDEEGIEFADLEAARNHAIKNAREVMASEVTAGHLCLGCAIVVRDADGADVLAVPFVEALTLTMTGRC